MKMNLPLSIPLSLLLFASLVLARPLRMPLQVLPEETSESWGSSDDVTVFSDLEVTASKSRSFLTDDVTSDDVTTDEVTVFSDLEDFPLASDTSTDASFQPVPKATGSSRASRSATQKAALLEQVTKATSFHHGADDFPTGVEESDSDSPASAFSHATLGFLSFVGGRFCPHMKKFGWNPRQAEEASMLRLLSDKVADLRKRITASVGHEALVTSQKRDHPEMLQIPQESSQSLLGTASKVVSTAWKAATREIHSI